jgi:hypothetical protein
VVTGVVGVFNTPPDGPGVDGVGGAILLILPVRPLGGVAGAVAGLLLNDIVMSVGWRDALLAADLRKESFVYHKTNSVLTSSPS